MSSPNNADSRSAKLQSSYKTLAAASDTLNAVSDKFSGAVKAIDEALNKLSPGVEAWVTVSDWTDEHQPWISHLEMLGFAKTSGRWGLSLSRVKVNRDDGSEETQDAWLFNDGPRNLRLRAIELLPDLVEALAREAERLAKKVSETAEIALQLSTTVSSAAVGRGKRQ